MAEIGCVSDSLDQVGGHIDLRLVPVVRRQLLFKSVEIPLDLLEDVVERLVFAFDESVFGIQKIDAILVVGDLFVDDAGNGFIQSTRVIRHIEHVRDGELRLAVIVDQGLHGLENGCHLAKIIISLLQIGDAFPMNPPEFLSEIDLREIVELDLLHPLIQAKKESRQIGSRISHHADGGFREGIVDVVVGIVFHFVFLFLK